MNINSKKFIFSLSLGATALLVAANGAKAAYFSPMTGYTADDLEAQINSGSFVEEFNASSYIGDDGGPAYELEIQDIDPPTDVVGGDQGQYSWENGQAVDFELSFDGQDLTYTVGGETIQSIDVTQGDFDVNGMLLSTNSTANSSATLRNLMFDDGDMSMEEMFSSDSEADFMKITGIDNTFSLTGTQVFEWDGERPQDLDLAYQIRVGTFQDSVASSAFAQAEIPEPGTVSLFSLGAIALGLKRRRSK
ncbi:conserved exported hypothetical protein [Hyella patelloides LEGE 07179]|uniref:Ice-binding protein C-terminal domain-containing protein n=1 Tax=Hyella patelloides LEGE 07179 TaxID=945734 RepID=A0A563W4R9_9CYAN|nr:PEP-CTERM sorting domain-containing protein [Hyella patelloides]VEP18640.1 conserved exported hypothetical protein [Hyella patelloides LEGE 07179]